MKKMIFVLTALLLAAPAMANLVISCSANGNDVDINYNATEDGNLPRGLGLEITVDNSATIDSISNESSDYWVYPGSIVIDPCTGTMTDQGTPVASGLGTSTVILEMGSLHYPTGPSDTNSPPLTGTLLTITVSGDCNIAIAGNGERGNVVRYAATEIGSGDLTYTGCQVAGCPCPGDVANTGASPSPDLQVDIGDLNYILIQMLTEYPGGDATGQYLLSSPSQQLLSCGDVANTGASPTPDNQIDIGDLNYILIQMLTQYPGGDATGQYLLSSCL
jgi:hypothetical protein